jgi:hypothetical protein
MRRIFFVTAAAVILTISAGEVCGARADENR